MAISPGHGQGNPNLSPYLVLVEEMDPWGGACVPKRTFPSNNGIRGDSVRGERENPRNLGHTLKPGLYFSTISHRMERTGRKAIGRSPY